ncbi:MAG: AtpZ/AtpI family protein [Cyclobacteriaceae bacterium]
MSPGPEKPRQLNPFLKYSSLAIQMAAAIGLAAWVGYRLDARAETSPLFLIILVLAAFSGLLYRLWLDLKNEK